MSNKHISLRHLALSDADALWALRCRNRTFFQPFEPIRPESHFTLEGQQSEITISMESANQGHSYFFGIILHESNELIGRISLTSIARGPFQNANLGYYLDQQYNGKGYATEAVSLCTQFAFREAGLHRIQAAVMPRNIASIRVLEKVGFRQEGMAKHYLQINGVWEDHNLYALTVEDIARP
ncbi:MAG: GNAT family N-acetyltransferase [Clostridia bacterium]